MGTVQAVFRVLVCAAIASAQSPAGAGQGRDLSRGPVDGERLAFFWAFEYEWTGPEGATIQWSADLSGNGMPLTVQYDPVTETWGIGGDGTVPVLVTAVMPEGSMTGSGSTSVDVGGTFGNGLVNLTILETTGGTYTITVDGYSMTSATPQNVNRYDMVFNWESVTGGLGDQVTQETANGFVSGRLELLDAWDPGL